MLQRLIRLPILMSRYWEDEDPNAVPPKDSMGEALGADQLTNIYAQAFLHTVLAVNGFRPGTRKYGETFDAVSKAVNKAAKREIQKAAKREHPRATRPAGRTERGGKPQAR